MQISKQISLLNNKPNFLDFPQSTIDPFKIDDEQMEFLLNSISMNLKRSKSHNTSKYVEKHAKNNFSNIDFVNILKYPLPAAYNKKTDKIIINISAVGKRSIQSLNVKDIYSLIVYGNTCYELSKNPDLMKKINPTFVAQYYSSLFLKLFGKQYGIVGSYLDLMPMTKFFIFMYILIKFYDLDKKKSIQLASNLSQCDVSKIDVNINDYDFKTMENFLKCLSDQELTSGLNLYRFLNKTLNIFGSYNMPMFEDCMRLLSVLFTSSIGGNTLFTPALINYNSNYYNKVIENVDSVLKRV